MPFSQQESVKRKAESTPKRLLKRRLSSTDPIDNTNIFSLNVEEVREQLSSVTLIENAPRDSVGYISVAQVYSMRGQQNRVIAITSEGMHNISKTDNDYEILKALYQNASARIAICIDFLAQLPYDLACTIVNYMPRKSRGACVKVSRTWRDRLLHYPKISRICTIYPVSYDPTLQLLPKITAHIKKLSIGCSSQLMFDKCMELLG
ncbi:hypothetical protein BDC45DRAFT_541603 [Circinella umbellata]|nr:hypothetical protein BDC45DRAFT_541603 [Circinella umbellata]